jgi:type II secretion system protein G
MSLPTKTIDGVAVNVVNKSTRAFTLIELLIVVAIIAILAALTLSTMGYVNKKGARSRAESEIAALSAAIERYRLEYGIYPSNQSVLFRELVGTGTINTNRVFFEPTPGMTTNMATGPFIDPWGAQYEYNTNATVNVGFFDLWTRAGETAANSNNWIRN